MQAGWSGDCINLRQQPQHLSTLVAWLHAEWFKQRKNNTQNPAEAYATRYQQLQEHLTLGVIPLTLVALDNGQPVGCISLTRLQSRQSAFADGLWVSNLFVVPAARGQGVASALLQAAEQQALHLAEYNLYLFTHSAVGYYQARGWQRCWMPEKSHTNKPVIAVLKKCLS